MSRFVDGDVVRYRPRDRHCREGLAVARAIDGAVGLYDTFWYDCSRRLRPDEEETAELVFNLHEWQEWDDRRDARPGHEWDDFAPEDRQVITYQHGIRRWRFVRPGAQPDRATMVARARTALEEAEQAVASAAWSLRERQRELDTLLTVDKVRP